MAKQDNFKEEYKQFIFDYLLRLIGLETDDINLIVNVEINDNSNGKVFDVDDNNILYFNTFESKMYCYKSNQNIDEDDIALMRCIIPTFFRISEYKENGSKNVDYLKSKIHKKNNYEYAIQSGICEWIMGSTSSKRNPRPNSTHRKIEEIFDVLDRWVTKTYEGKHVSYGLIYDPDCENNIDVIGSDDFVDFLNDEFSAVLSDSITSVFVLNKKCELIGYETILDHLDSNDRIVGTQLINNLPLRFADIISKTVINNRVGIFLLTNGDLILCKKQAIRFVKRENKWLNFNIRAFKNALSEFISQNNISNKLIDEIYSSALDVSFSHAGGIIALDLDISKIVDSQNERNRIVNRCDYLCDDTDEEIENYLINKNNDLDKLKIDDDILKKDIKKKLLKRNVIKKLVNNNDFLSLNRKLKSELIALDGACIIDSKGYICSFGAIIQNDSGSSGGGRGAAAKKLSANGFAIKISTDGYIELYYMQNKIFVIK